MRHALVSLSLVAAMLAPGAALAATSCPERVLDDSCCEREATPNATIAGLCCCTVRELPDGVSVVDSPALAVDGHDLAAASAAAVAPGWMQPQALVQQSSLPACARAPPAPTLLSLHTSLIC